jgi:hypothetical protein
MNAKDIRRYWVNKCRDKNKDFQSDKYVVEVILLKKLIDRYSEYVVLEAMDHFLDGPAKPLSIMYFAKSSVFDSKFSDIIKLQPILKYKRSLMSVSMSIRDRMHELIEEYLLYSRAYTLSDEEKLRKQFIIKELESLC